MDGRLLANGVYFLLFSYLAFSLLVLLHLILFQFLKLTHASSHLRYQIDDIYHVFNNIFRLFLVI